MNPPKISVIVPVYNVEKYLNRCIDSILAQTFKDFEVLLIDDGSTDQSGKICDEYGKKDNRVRVFHNTNSGVSAEREFGIQHAKGDYIQFVDSDDWIDVNMLKSMYDYAIIKNADIVGCNFYEIYKDHKNYIRTYYRDSQDFIKDIIKSHWGVVWKLLCKRELYSLANIHFPKGINGGEDYFVCVSLMLAANNIVSIDKGFYFYNRCNENSLMSSTNIKKIEDQISATRLVEDLLKKRNLEITYKSYLDRRKFYSKLPLLKIYPLRWFSIFPECNKIYRDEKIGLKLKFFIWLILIYSNFFYKATNIYHKR